MKRVIITAAGLLLLAAPAAYGISTKYRQQLEQSGCTQMSEAEGCDINKSKAENAKAGFSNQAAESAPASQSPPLRRTVGGQEQRRQHSGDHSHRW